VAYSYAAYVRRPSGIDPSRLLRNRRIAEQLSLFQRSRLRFVSIQFFSATAASCGWGLNLDGCLFDKGAQGGGGNHGTAFDAKLCLTGTRPL